ncbi:MAG: gas vesicle protein GvpJ [Candidatus Angelobacter sp.]
MVPLIPNTDDLISLLDRVLDKGIVLEAWAHLSLQGCDLVSTDSRVTVKESAVYVGYGKRGTWREDAELEDLFPFWRRELWSKQRLARSRKF